MKKYVLILILFIFSSSNLCYGASEGWSLGGLLGTITVKQDDLNLLNGRSNTRDSGISTSQLSNAWEIGGFISYRFASSFVAFQLRPTYMFQSEEGSSATGNNYKYSASSFTIFPMFKFYLLEDTMLKFFTQVGVGYGFMSGEIEEAGRSVDFSGGDLGFKVGLGAELCFTDTHCVFMEGNYRLLRTNRTIAKSVTGDFSTLTGPASLSQATKDQEVEVDGRDLGLSMTGVQGFLGYEFHF